MSDEETRRRPGRLVRWGSAFAVAGGATSVYITPPKPEKPVPVPPLVATDVVERHRLVKELRSIVKEGVAAKQFELQEGRGDGLVAAPREYDSCINAIAGIVGRLEFQAKGDLLGTLGLMRREAGGLPEGKEKEAYARVLSDFERILDDRRIDTSVISR